MVEKILPTGRIESFEYDDLGYLTSYSPGKGIFYRYGARRRGIFSATPILWAIAAMPATMNWGV